MSFIDVIDYIDGKRKIVYIDINSIDGFVPGYRGEKTEIHCNNGEDIYYSNLTPMQFAEKINNFY